MKTFKEARGDTAVFTFGRFNPPTTGHEKLIDALAKQQGKNAGSLMYVYPSHSQDAKKNPLPHARKIAYMKKMFRKYAKNIITSKSRNVFEIATELHNKGHRAVVMVVGSDRVAEFDNLLNKYNGVEGKHGYYGFDDIRVVSAGDRDPDAEGVEGMSASKMRAAAAQGDFDSFKMGVPRNFGDAKKLYDDVRKNMGVREQNWTDEEIMRDAYIRGEVWNVGDVVKTKLGEEGTIIRKGTNYVVFEDMQRVWLHDLVEEPKKITKTKQAKGEVGDMKGTQPAKYYSKDTEGDEMSLATKKARARHFAKGDSRKPAPGDKGAKTRPSQYTKKFKQMYGEQDKEKKPAQSDVMKDREQLRDLEVKKRMATLQAKIAQDQEKLAKMQIADKQAKDRQKTDERKLTDGEKSKLKDLEKEVPKKDFIDRYGKEEGEAIYYATLTKMAKKESLWANIHKKRQRIKQGSGERMRKKGEKGAPTPAQMKRAKGESNESYEIGKDYADHTKEIDPYSAPQNERSTLKKDKKLPNLMIPKKGKAGVTKFMKRKNINKLAAEKESVELDEKIAGLVNKSEKTGVPYSILKKSYDRGMAAWKGGHRPGATQQQWAFARVNSMLTGGKADPDLQKQIKKGGYKKKKKASKESVEEWFSSDQTIKLYQERYGDEWLKKLNNTYEKMLSKLDESCCDDCDKLYDHVIMEAEYQGRKVKLNDPFRLPTGSKKKFGVYVKNEKGNIVKVTFGDPNMGINRDDPEARKNFRARHSCDDNPGPKYKARYWSCYQWRAGAKVDN
tara:strand:+ start:1130 stop:3478 length:2349 start_codon:yes stop_codon:yes gene_type:complete